MDIRKGNDVNVYFDIDALDIVKAEDVKSIRCFFVKDAYVETGGIPTPPDSCIPSSYVIHDHMPPTYNVHVPHWHISRCVHREFSVLDNCSPGWHGNTIFVNKSFLIVTISSITYIKTSFDGSMQRNGRYDIVLEVLSKNDDLDESNVKYTFDYGHLFDIIDNPSGQSGKIDIYPTKKDIVDTVHCVDVSKYEYEEKFLPIDPLAVYTYGNFGGVISPVYYTTENDFWILFCIEKSQDGTTDKIAAFKRNDGPGKKFMYHTTYVGSDIPQWVKDIFGIQVVDITTFTEACELLQNQIDAIINDKAVISLSATPSPVFVGVESNISLVANTNTTATSIKIKKGNTEIATGSGLTLSGSDIITPTVVGNTAYAAEFTISGLQKTTTKNVVAVYPIKYGAGQSYTDAQTQASARISPAGTYNVTVADNGDYVFFVVPRTMNINSAKMSGFDFPLLAPVNIEIDDVEYKYYQSSNTYDAGILTIVIS